MGDKEVVGGKGGVILFFVMSECFTRTHEVS